MKYLRLISILFCLSACQPKWQADNSDAFLTIPSIHVLLTDSISMWDSKQLPTGRPLVVFYFSPDCEHCAYMTNYLMDNFRSLQEATLVFVSNAPLDDIRKFSQRFHLNDHLNIIIGNDQQYNVFNIYKINSFPEIMIYNRQQRLTKLYKGEIDIEQFNRAIKS